MESACCLCRSCRLRVRENVQLNEQVLQLTKKADQTTHDLNNVTQALGQTKQQLKQTKDQLKQAEAREQKLTALHELLFKPATPSYVAAQSGKVCGYYFPDYQFNTPKAC